MEEKKRKHKKRTSERWINMAETGWNRGWWSYIYDLINKNLILAVKKQTWYGWIDVADYEQLHFYPELNSIA